jgi:hypothetical protein
VKWRETALNNNIQGFTNNINNVAKTVIKYAGIETQKALTLADKLTQQNIKSASNKANSLTKHINAYAKKRIDQANKAVIDIPIDVVKSAMKKTGISASSVYKGCKNYFVDYCKSNYRDNNYDSGNESSDDENKYPFQGY